jgi:hypothetical protein
MSSTRSRDEETGPWIRVKVDDQAGCTSELIDDFYAREDSMEITNDPRFFSGNVIDKRLTAFGSVGIISGFMISVTFSELNDMDKSIDFPPWNRGWNGMDDCLQLAAFGILTYALFCNMVATFVSVAQTYYTYRLMTAGPTGFEMATKFYLDAYITWWRLYAIKHVLVSLPLLIVGHGGRMIKKFDKPLHDLGKLKYSGNVTAEAVAIPAGALLGHSIYGFLAMLVYMVIGAMILTIHWKHRQRFADFYVDFGEKTKDMQAHKLQRGGGGSQRNMRPEI